MPSTPNYDPLRLGANAVLAVIPPGGGAGFVQFDRPLDRTVNLLDTGLKIAGYSTPTEIDAYEAGGGQLAYDEFNPNQLNCDWEIVSPPPDDPYPLSYLQGQGPLRAISDGQPVVILARGLLTAGATIPVDAA